MRSNCIKPYFVKLCYVSTFEEKVIYSRGSEVVKSKVEEDIESSVPAILKFLKESIIKSGNIGPRLVFIDIFSTIAISGLVTKENM